MLRVRRSAADRVYACVRCGHVQDRGVNAVHNIHMKGLVKFTRPGLSAWRQAAEGYLIPLAARSNDKATPGYNAESYGKAIHLSM